MMSKIPLKIDLLLEINKVIFYDRLKKKIGKKANYLYCSYLQKSLVNRNFTIISNNCWGGSVYEDLDLEYLTPFVGLFIYAPCYIKLLSDLKYYLSLDLKFRNESIYPEAGKILLENNYPLGVLGDIEIHFLHYTTGDEAYIKWNRRKARISFENIFVKMCDRDLCNDMYLKTFDNLPFKKKIFFSSRNISDIKSLVYLDKYKGQPYIGDIYSDRWAYRERFNVVDWLNNKQTDESLNSYSFI
jgi:uncharacterized protein (DUF1919 family)